MIMSEMKYFHWQIISLLYVYSATETQVL